MAKIILFVDALEPREIDGTRFADTERGYVNSGAPKVTPKVTSEVQTGLDPTHTNFGGQHSMNGDREGRPHAPMLAEKLEAAGYTVGSFYMPYSHPQQIESQLYVSDTMQGPQPGQHPLAQMNVNPPASGDLMDPDDDGSHAWNARTDEIYARSSNMLNTIRGAGLDVAFIGIRSPDQYTHFQWHEDYRRKLLEDIAFEVQRWEQNHDVLWWSDHGSEEKTETFRVNRYLMDEGLLDVDIDLDFHERFTDEMESRQPPNEGGRNDNIENALPLHAPGVEIQDGSVAASFDAYDSCVDLLDEEADVDEVVRVLEKSGMYDRVVPVEEEWGSGPYRDSSPDIVTLRADNVLVTGNVHPEPIGMGFMRSGVHSKKGAWGTTDEDFTMGGDVTPRELHNVIFKFVTGTTEAEQEMGRQLQMLERQFEAAQQP